MLISETPFALLKAIDDWQAANGRANGGDLINVFAEFCDEPCSDSLPESEDGDALLLQYGSSDDVNGQPTFHIDAVRQLTKDSAAQQIYQLHLTMRWPADDETKALGSHSAWLFDGDGDEFWEEVLAQPGWQWFLSGAALECRCEIWFEGLDEPVKPPFEPHVFEVSNVPDAQPVVLPYQYNRQLIGFGIASPAELPPAVEQELRDRMWLQVVLGDVYTTDFADTHALDYAEYADYEQLVGFYDSLLKYRAYQQMTWGAERPKSNLNLAFEELNDAGILALEDFSCCGNCAADEIRAELDAENPPSLFVYYHRQNSERFVQDRQGWVSFGAVARQVVDRQLRDEWRTLSEDEQRKRYDQLVADQIRTRVVPVFERHGIEVVWDGDPGTNLQLVGADYYCHLGN